MSLHAVQYVVCVWMHVTKVDETERPSLKVLQVLYGISQCAGRNLGLHKYPFECCWNSNQSQLTFVERRGTLISYQFIMGLIYIKP